MALPRLVRVIAVLYYISAFINSLAGFLIAMLGVVLILTTTAAVGTYGPFLVIAFGVLAFAFGFLQFLVGKGLWHGREGSRIAAVVISLVCVSVGVWQLIASSDYVGTMLLTIFFSLFIALYLLLSPGVRESFS